MNSASIIKPQVLLAALLVLLALTLPAAAQIPLTQVSADTLTNSASQHATEVEPDTYSFGNTIVSAFQVGRISSGGGGGIGWATSTDGGNTWLSGYLPQLTQAVDNGPYTAASDASVAYDAKHGVWLVSTLPLSGPAALTVSRSFDGVNWLAPVVTNTGTGSVDKNWIACDNTATSPFYGSCYQEWDNPNSGAVKMSVSTDGGVTWGTAKTVTGANGLGGQPVVQPNGTLVVPFESNGGKIQYFRSTNGGASYTTVGTIATIQSHSVAAGIRTSPLPSVEVDKAGKLYVVWQDCRFRTSCKENDIVMSTSTNGTTWTAVARIPIDPTTSTVDHFIPGIGVDHNTAGTGAHLVLTYYYYPVASCTTTTCQLYTGSISSTNGGSTWTAPNTLAGPATITWLPNTFSGRMVGDYISTSFVNGKAFSVFAVPNPLTGSTFNQPMFTEMGGLTAPSFFNLQFSGAADRPVPGVKGDKLASWVPERQGGDPDRD